MASDVRFEIDGKVYALQHKVAAILAENLRGFAAGNFPADVERLGPDESWVEAARETADWIETWLVESPDKPIPLERGKTAQAAYQALCLMSLEEAEPNGAAALRTALGYLLKDAA